MHYSNESELKLVSTLSIQRMISDDHYHTKLVSFDRFYTDILCDTRPLDEHSCPRCNLVLPLERWSRKLDFSCRHRFSIHFSEKNEKLNLWT